MSSLILYLFMVAAFFALIQGWMTFAEDMREESRLVASQLRLRRPTFADGVSPWLREILLTAPIRSFDNLVQTCGLTMRTERVLLGMTVLTLLAVITADVLLLNPLASFAAGAGFGILLPLFLLTRLRKRRMTRLARQLPETLDTMVRSLRAGHPIPPSIAMISREMSAPIGVEFKRVHEAMSYGLDLRDALTKMTDRLHTVEELKYISAAIRIQSMTGGNLAEILAALATLMRDQQKLKMKVKAISAEGRLSGNILAALPVGVVILLNVINPSYYRGILDEEIPSYIMGFCAFLIVMGYIMIRRIVDIRV